MSCSKEEIEKKRLAAIAKRRNKITSPSENKSQHFNSSSFTNSFNGTTINLTSSPSVAGPIKSLTSNTYKSFHPYVKPGNVSKHENIGKNAPINTKVVTGTVYLISEDRFEVNPSEFCGPLVNVFKSIPSKSYDSNTKLWSFSINDYEELMRKVAPLAPDIVLGAMPPYILKFLKETPVDPNSIDLSSIEGTLRHKLMPFQEDGVRFAIAKRGRCMIADDMGLGKTFQALAVASYYRHDWPMLIVTTSSMREIWQSKIHELLPSVPMMNIATLGGNKDAQLVADRRTEVVIASYKLTATHVELLKDKRFGVVIIDESHYLKSRKARCTGALTALCKPASRSLLLSGTPALSRPAELYTQLAIIHPTFFQGGFVDYGKRYCAGKFTNFGWDMSGQSHLAELQVLLQRKFLIRRTKDQVLHHLQDKIRESVMLDQTLLEFSKEDQSGLSQVAERYAKTKSSERHAALLTFFSESARVKIPAICKYIKQHVQEDGTDKFLVFAHHRTMIEAICLTLDELDVNYICIVGSTPPASRAELVDKFQQSESCRAAVLSTTAAGAGLTLTAARLVLFAELHWNPGVLTQAEARAHRLGSAGGVCVRYLLARGTADDHMWPLLQGKLTVLNDVGLSKDNFDDATLTLQKSSNNITQYLSQCNRNDYIPGTNIRKSSQSQNHKQVGSTSQQSQSKSESSHRLSEDNEDMENSFLINDDDDELLANLDLS